MGLDELALCVAREKIPMSWQAESVAIPIIADELKHWDGDNHLFRCRRDIENDFSLKQIIPYVLVFNENDEILIYQRHGTEERLHNLWSLGIGGHVNSEDGNASDFTATLIYGMKRECKEELGVEINDFSLLGIINEEKTEVGHAHIGIVFKTKVSSHLPASDELKNWRFTNTDRLSNLKFELWSSLAMRLILENNYKE